ncbi:tail protein [Gordonia phage Lamberg]|uniref:Minor tail protein n=1 Tax=Gordonia phage Lamberg TaxID=2790987 RepID=A0A7T3KBK8_9CAUD|nr:tail protein [Gordonia phage Lamberg]QPX62261.1 minor tail protein [Gordonia phage Lamberg]UXE04692.1 minor tail protein [Gordonia phage Nettuno]
MSTPSLDWSSGEVVLDVNVGKVTTVDVPIPRGVEVLVVQGKDGTGVELRGAVLTYADLPDDLGPLDAGASYVVQDNGKLYVWSGTAWPTEPNGADFRGQQGFPGRGITGVSVLGNKLRFAMSDSTIDEATVPALQQAIDSAAAASGSATAADTARLAAEAAASTAGAAASTATSERTAAQAARTGAEGARDAATTAATAADNSADAAATSETNAETAETNAAGSALAAAGSASTANTRATDADTARAAAVTARTDAQTARDTASGYATAAQTAADAAGDSAAAAAASAEEAADVVASGVPNATDSTKGGIVLAGDLAGTWDEPTVPGLAGKADLVDGKVPTSQIPSQALIERRVVVSTAARLALTDVQPGDVAIQIGNPGRGTYILADPDPSVEESWSMFIVPDSPVSSVNGYTGIVILGKGDVGLGSVDNTSDANKPISTATQTALDGKLPKRSGANVVYTNGADGNPSGQNYTSAPTNFTMAFRNGAGTFQVGTPTDPAHPATKDYIDTALAGKSNVGHTHSASEITSGTLDVARLPVGTGSTQVAAGNDSRIVNAVPNTRTVSAGTGLSGGGDLTANRTLAVAYGTAAGTAAQGNDARLSDTRTPTDNTVSTAKIQDGAVTLAKLATAVSTSIQQMIDASVLAAQQVAVNAQTGAYTLVATDANKAVEVTSGSAVNVTIPTNASVGFPIGTVIEVDQMGAGKVTIVGASGVTVQSAVATPTSRAQYSALVLRKRAADLWLVTGDLA